jgi:RNA polymerase sigma-70 factor (ECF subfamily)
MKDQELAELYRRCGALIYRRCLKLLGDSAAAQDATQEVFIRLMSQIDRLEARDDDYLPWIYRVATNHCLNLLRDDARLALFEPGALPDTATHGEAAAYPERDLTARLLRRFDEVTRSIAVLSLVDNLSQDEVAEVLGVSRKTVGKKLRLFLERARRFMQRAA